MKWAAISLAAVLTGFASGQSGADDAAGPTVSFAFDWALQTPAHYEITVRPDGMGLYRAMPTGPAATDGTDAAAEGRPLLLSPRAVARLQAAAAVVSAGKTCETSTKKLAQTGSKTLRVERGGGAVQTCTYNYSDDKRIQDATATFQAIAMTMQEAPRLEHLHRFDRLGLDAELAVFTQSVREGRAIELGNIAPTLRSLATDNDLMERVRLRAADLLQHAGSSPSS